MTLRHAVLAAGPRTARILGGRREPSGASRAQHPDACGLPAGRAVDTLASCCVTGGMRWGTIGERSTVPPSAWANSKIASGGPMDAVLLFLLTSLALVGSPGPNTLSLAALGAAFGMRRVVPYMLGLDLGMVAVVALVGSGLWAAVLSSPRIAPVVTFAASAYLIFLAYRIATAPPLRTAAAGSAARPPSLACGRDPVSGQPEGLCRRGGCILAIFRLARQHHRRSVAEGDAAARDSRSRQHPVACCRLAARAPHGQPPGEACLEHVLRGLADPFRSRAVGAVTTRQALN